jgi:hypothetical protein
MFSIGSLLVAVCSLALVIAVLWSVFFDRPMRFQEQVLVGLVAVVGGAFWSRRMLAALRKRADE